MKKIIQRVVFLVIASLIIGLNASAAEIVTFIDDTFTDSTAPWNTGQWKKIGHAGTATTSEPAGGEYVFVHNPSESGTVRIKVNAEVGKPAGAALISTIALDPTFTDLLSASVTFASSDQQINRLILNDNTTSLYDGNYLFAQVTDYGGYLQVLVNNGSGNIYSENLFSSDNIGDGDILRMVLDATHLVLLTYYDADNDTTYTLIGPGGSSGAVTHEKNWATDFLTGIHLAQEALKWAADVPVQSLTFDRLQASATRPFGVKAVHLPFRPQSFSVEDYQTTIDEIATLGYNTLILGAGGIYSSSYTIPSPGQLQFDTWSTTQVEDLISYIRNAGLEPIFEVKVIGKLDIALETLSQQNPGLITNVSSRPYGVLNPAFTFSDGKDPYEKILLPMLDDIIALYGSSPPNYIHLGMDEIPVDDLQSIATQLSTTVPELFADLINQCTDHLIDQGITPILWSDMFLGEKLREPGHGVIGFDHDPRIVRGNSSFLTTNGSSNPPSTLTSINSLSNLTEIIIADWHYEAYQDGAYPSVDYFQTLGFQVWGASKNNETGIREFSRYASERGATGMIATTWDVWANSRLRHRLPALLGNSALYFYFPGFVPKEKAPTALWISSAGDMTASLTNGGAFTIPSGTVSYAAKIALSITPINPVLTVLNEEGEIVQEKLLSFNAGTQMLNAAFVLPTSGGATPRPYTVRLDLKDEETSHIINHELPQHLYSVDQLPIQAGSSESYSLISGNFTSLTFAQLFDSGTVYATGTFPALLKLVQNPNPGTEQISGVLDCQRHGASAFVPGLWEKIVEKGMTSRVYFTPKTTNTNTALITLGSYNDGFRLLVLSNGDVQLQFAKQKDNIYLFSQLASGKVNLNQENSIELTIKPKVPGQLRTGSLTLNSQTVVFTLPKPLIESNPAPLGIGLEYSGDLQTLARPLFEGYIRKFQIFLGLNP